VPGARRKSTPKPKVAPPKAIFQQTADAEPDAVDDGPASALIKQVGKLASKAKERGYIQAPVAIQLPIWDESERGLPNSLARGALFTAIKQDVKTGQRAYFSKKRIGSLNSIVLEYKGEELRQDDASVFMTLLHMARHQALGQPVHFTAYSMLKELNWSINSYEYQHLRECCERLSATNVSVQVAKGEGYGGSLVRKFAWKDIQSDEKLSHWIVWLEPQIASLFDSNSFTRLNWNERRRIGGRSPLALWLHSFFCTHREPIPMSVERYYVLTGSRSSRLADFRGRMRQALQRLVELEFLLSYTIRNDTVHVRRNLDTKRLQLTE